MTYDWVWRPITCRAHVWRLQRKPCRRKVYRHLFNSSGVLCGTFCREHTAEMISKLD